MTTEAGMRDAWRRAPLAGRLRRVLADAVHALDAAEATLWAFDDVGDAMVAALNVGPTAALVEAQAVPASESVVGLVATHGTPMVVGPGDWQNRAVERAGAAPVTAMVVVPVRLGGDVVGALSVVNPTGRERFGAPDLERAAWHAFLLEAVLTHDATRHDD